MKSMYTILAEATAGFNEAQHKEFNRRSRDLGSGASAETLVNIAESVSKDETLRESGGIRRNNGASTYAESDRILMQGLAKARPHSFGKLAELKKAERRLTPQQQKDKEFCLLLETHPESPPATMRSSFGGPDCGIEE